MIKRITLLHFIVLQSIFGFSQNIDLSSLPEVEDYIVQRTNPEADTIIIALHGGPIDRLDTGEFEFYENIPTISLVEMKQYQHINQNVLHDTTINLSQATAMNDTTVALLHKVVNHFKDQNKIIALLGHSFGGFLLHEYLDDYGINNIDKIISLGARLNMNQIAVDFFLMGHEMRFKDGVIVDTRGEASEDFKTTITFIAAIVQDRYLDSISTLDLTKFMVVYGTHDEAVGRLLTEEVERLRSLNATIYKIEDGSHNDTFWNVESNQAVLSFIRDREILASVENTRLQNQIKLYPTITKDLLNVDSNQHGHLSLFDSTGKQHFEKEIHPSLQRIILPNLNQGQYVVIFQNDSNQLTSYKLLIASE